jgi:hypothetical protein
MQMKKKEVFVLTCLLTSAILVTCGPSQAERDAQATKIAADIFATQTAEAPTPTPLPPTSIHTPEPTGITITGEIANLEKARSHLADDSYLQLVLLPPDGQLSGGSDERGRIFYDSELPKTRILSDGAFIFRAESLEPGKYLIAAQLLEDSFDMDTLLKKGEGHVIVEIPQNVRLPQTIDVGEVTIALPTP